MIELYLSSDGKHTVHVSAETPAQMNELAPYARGLYERVLQQYGTKPQLWEAARNGQANGQTPAAKESAPAVPHCPEHQTPLKYRKGRFGSFWSCPTRQPDGSWCTCTQQVAPATNGHQAPSLPA